MASEKVQIKLFASADADVMAYVPVFHGLIRNSALNELMIDVVDYSHVVNGPEVLLVGHASDYAIDRGEGRLGLLYQSKREPETAEGPFLAALRRTLRMASLLEKAEGPKPPLKFRTDEFQLRIADRLRAPNEDATLTRIEAELRAALVKLFGDVPITLRRVGEPRDMFGLAVGVAGAPPLSDLLSRLH
jgi:hypothetical protein